MIYACKRGDSGQAARMRRLISYFQFTISMIFFFFFLQWETAFVICLLSLGNEILLKWDVLYNKGFAP